MDKIKILILDDTQNQREEVIANLIPTNDIIKSKQRYDFIKQHFDIVERSRPTEAEAYLCDKENTKPDLIISDINFQFPDSPENHGDMRGIQFIGFVANNFPNIPTIAVTFYGIDRILQTLQDTLPNLNISNIYAVRREDDQLNIANLNNVRVGLPSLFRRIAEQKIAAHTLTPEQQTAMLQLTATNEFWDKIVTTQTQYFMIKDLLLGWASIEKQKDQSLSLVYNQNATDVLHKYLDEIELNLIGQMNTDHARNLIRNYFHHPNHQNWVNEIRKNVQDMLTPFFHDNWKYLGEDYSSIEGFLTSEIGKSLAENIQIQGGDYLDLNKANLNINNEDTIEKIKNLLMARLIVLTIMSRRSVGQHFQYIPNVADLAIFVAIGNDRLQDFLDALYFIRIGNRPKVGTILAINANSRKQSHIKSYFSTKLCISGKLTINVDIKKDITFDTFDETKLLPEEIEWLKYIDEKKLFL